jgi:hypothetical protein
MRVEWGTDKRRYYRIYFVGAGRYLTCADVDSDSDGTIVYTGAQTVRGTLRRYRRLRERAGLPVPDLVVRGWDDMMLDSPFVEYGVDWGCV